MRIVTLLLACLYFFTATAQQEVIVHGIYPNLYVTHRIAPKQTIYSIGRLYNQQPQAVSNANKLVDENYLKDGALINIPLTTKNFTQDGQKDKEEALVPLYYIIQPGDNLFHISQMYNKVRIDFLREWNNIAKDEVQKAGQSIIIGHLKVSKDNVRYVNTGLASAAEPEKAPETTPTKPTTQPETQPNTKPNTDEGFFVTEFPSTQGKQPRLVNGEASTFKTTSGWSDKKYYVLMNNVAPGTIVRVTTENNGSICAKVLGPLPDMKENKGLLIRLSNSAASVLRMNNDKFDVTVGYY